MIKKIFPAFGTMNSVAIFDDCDCAILEQIKQHMLQMHNRFSFFVQRVKLLKSIKKRVCIQLQSGKTLFICYPSRCAMPEIRREHLM